MSYPILYEPTETKFDHNGLGILGDCAACEVVEEANGMFELSMAYPIDGIHYSEIADRSIIKAKADQFRDPQIFRVYSISQLMSGVVMISARHISYDLSGIPVKPFSADSATLALSGLKNNAVVDCPFDFWTDKSANGKFSISVPASIRSRLGGVAGSVLDVYGGEYEFDNFVVKLHKSRGLDRGVSVRYGKNLTDIQQERNCAAVATGVYPYWVDSEGSAFVELPERIVNAPGKYNFVKIITLDLSSEFESQPTVEQLRSRTESYINANNIGVPSVSLTVSFAQLEQSEEYKHLKLLERVGLFDAVNVEFPALGVSATAKAVKMVYDVLADRVKSVALGSVRANIADTVANHQKEIQQAPTKTDLKKAQEAATAWLTNGKGFKVERRDEVGNIIDTLYLDTPDIDQAVNVLRIGQSGIGFSNNGVNGPYYSAWTIDGKFNADFISGGTISSQDGKVSISLVGGEEPVILNTGLSTNGLILRGDSIGASKLVQADAVNVGENETLRVLFYTEDGRVLSAVSHVFDGTKHTGLQYRSYNVDSSGNRMNGLDVRSGGTDETSFSGFYLIDGNNNDEIKGYFIVYGKNNPVSELRCDKIGDLFVSWKNNGDGTWTLIGQK